MGTDLIRKQMRLAWDEEARSAAFAGRIRGQLKSAGASLADEVATGDDILAS